MIRSIINNPVFSICIVLLLTLAAYSNIFPNDFVMDDFDFVVDWPLIRDLGNIPQFFAGYTPPLGQEGIYSPLKTVIHAVNYNLFGLDPIGHHVFSILVHFAAVIVIYHLSFYFTKNRAVAFLSALLFGLHPVHAGAIGNVTGSVDVVGIVFMLVSFILFAKATEQAPLLQKKYYIGSLITGLVALFTHELCLSLPILLLWYGIVFSRGQCSCKEIIKRTVPFFAIALFYVLCKFLVLQSVTRGAYIYDSFYLTMMVMIKAWAKYVLISFFPITLTHNHMIAPGISSFDPGDFNRFAVLSQSLLELQTLLSALFLGGIFYVAWLVRNTRPLITFCIGWFFICLLPGSNIIPSGVYFAERYLYPGSWAFCLLLAVFFNNIIEAQKEKKNGQLKASLTLFIIAAVASGYMARTWIRSADLRDQVTLHEMAVKANPQSALLRSDLGLVYTEQGMLQKAVASFHASLNIRPDDPTTHFALSEAYIQLKDFELAKKALEWSIQLDPRFADAHYNLAGLSALMGDAENSRVHLDKSLQYFREQGREMEAQAHEKVFKEFFGPFEGT